MAANQQIIIFILQLVLLVAVLVVEFMALAAHLVMVAVVVAMVVMPRELGEVVLIREVLLGVAAVAFIPLVPGHIPVVLVVVALGQAAAGVLLAVVVQLA